MKDCTCDRGICHGPGLLAADFLYQVRQESSSARRRRRDDAGVLQVLINLSILIRSSGRCITVDVAELADRCGQPPARIEELLDFLVEERFLALEGKADGRTRLWINPAVAFDPWDDPRVLAARHQFPYIDIAEGGMSAAEPVRITPYSEELWEAVYANLAPMLADPPMFDCELHGTAFKPLVEVSGETRS